MGDGNSGNDEKGGNEGNNGNVGRDPGAGSGGTPKDGQGSAEPALSISDAMAAEGGTLRFRVTLDSPSDRRVTVQYRTVGRTATEGADYEPASGTLTFSPGARRRTVSVRTRADATDEPNETIAVRLRNPDGATLRDAVGVGTIIGDVERRVERTGRALLPELGRALAFDAAKCRLDQAFPAPRRRP